jgi:tRNA (adenine37-N6)-methyltransferase
MRKAISVKPIGVIRTPYKEPKGMPIQGKFEKGITGTIRLFPEYRAGLKDIKGFSHLILIYHFNRSKEERLSESRFLKIQKTVYSLYGAPTGRIISDFQ